MFDINLAGGDDSHQFVLKSLNFELKFSFSFLQALF